MNGTKARAIRKAVYGDRMHNYRAYTDQGGHPVGIGPIGNPKRQLVGVSGGILHADQARKLYQHAKRMHKTKQIMQRTRKFN